MATYRHRQPGRTILWTMFWVGAAIAVVGAALYPGLSAEGRLGVWWTVVPTLAVLALLGWLFGSLTVEVDGRRVALWFGPGWPRKTIPLGEIRGVAPVRNSWWYGWGIRLTPHGWLYNVSGLDAVELELASGRRLRIGTDEPERLSAAVREAIEGRVIPGP